MAGSSQRTPQDLANWHLLDDDPSVLPLEYMKYGDLHGMIAKTATAGVVVPELIAWRIFFCRKFNLYNLEI